MHTKNLCWFLALGLAVGTAGTVTAGNENRVGTAGAQELRIPVSARGVALGDGFMADASGVDALWYNPAGAARVDGTEAYFSHLTYLADTEKNYFAIVTNTGIGALGASIDVFDIGDIQETTEENPEGTGQIFSPTFTVIGVSYAKYMTDAVSIGATGRFISEDIIQTSAQGVSFDIGIQYQPGWEGLRLGFALKNFGPNMQFDGEDFGSTHQTGDDPNSLPRVLRTDNATFELPSLFEIGLAYSPSIEGDLSLDAFGTFTNHNFGGDEFNLGVEGGYQDMLALRLGYVASANEDYNFGLTFGAGFKIPMGGSSITVDYARRMVKDYFDDNDLIALKYAF
ncbi:MAG: PorV/PorQ family protein [Candidatus Eisenbacteria bacterium]